MNCSLLVNVMGHYCQELPILFVIQWIKEFCFLKSEALSLQCYANASERRRAFLESVMAPSVCFLKAPSAPFVWTVCFWPLWKQLISAPFHWSCAAHAGKARVPSTVRRPAETPGVTPAHIPPLCSLALIKTERLTSPLIHEYQHLSLLSTLMQWLNCSFSVQHWK